MKYETNASIAENGVCPFIKPLLLRLINSLSIVLFISMMLLLLQPAILAHSKVTGFGLIIKQ